jgi:hypothetical protein
MRRQVRDRREASWSAEAQDGKMPARDARQGGRLMQVKEKVDLGDGHFIEFGSSTWDETQESIRNRYPTSTGGFSPHSSSEMPLGDLEELILASARHGWIDVATMKRIMEALAGVIDGPDKP